MTAAGQVIIWLAGVIVCAVIILGIAGAAEEPYRTWHVNGHTCTQSSEHARIVCR